MKLEMVIRMQIEILDGGEIQQVKIEKIKFLGISRYKFELMFCFNFNSSASSSILTRLN